MNDLPTRKIRLLMELRSAGITDTATLSAIETVPRESFVESQFLDQAYANSALPISCGQTISQPLVVGLMTQALELTDRHKVLEVGTGSGYQAAILAAVCRRVYTIERHRELLAQAEGRFKKLGIHNVTAMVGDGYKGWPAQAPFDRIICTAASRVTPSELVAQLSDEGGIMVLPVGDPAGLHQEVIRVRKDGKKFHSERMFPVRFVPMVQGVPDVGKGR
ncbi:MAG: protein-L-isoaspartate(D-aspartate) O-methyltransferase [Alphaproteobacteria bacterium]|nr:protein-L-isoaspartate(D-aspartate) O-methyltransferase [Alphaproteobacteria bacterium]